ncbi:hypothetical protein J6590_094468, partial [Homalodisca vitripennis]
ANRRGEQAVIKVFNKSGDNPYQLEDSRVPATTVLLTTANLMVEVLREPGQYKPLKTF